VLDPRMNIGEISRCRKAERCRLTRTPLLNPVPSLTNYLQLTPQESGILTNF
jgi:hypothetical protein